MTYVNGMSKSYGQKEIRYSDRDRDIFENKTFDFFKRKEENLEKLLKDDEIFSRKIFTQISYRSFESNLNFLVVRTIRCDANVVTPLIEPRRDRYDCLAHDG